MADSNTKKIVKQLEDAGFSHGNALKLMEGTFGSGAREKIDSMDSEQLGALLNEELLPYVQKTMFAEMQKYPNSADNLATKAGNLAKSVQGSEWDRDRFLKTLGREKGEDGAAHIGQLTDADYINLQLNGIGKAEADRMADKYRGEYQQGVAEQENALMPTRLRDARVQAAKDATEDGTLATLTNFIAPRAVESIENQAAEGEDIEFPILPTLADIAEDGLMFVNPLSKTGVVAKGLEFAGKAAKPVVQVLGKGFKQLNNPVLKYGAGALGENLSGAVSDAALDLGAEGLAALGKGYDFNAEKPMTVLGSSYTAPLLLGGMNAAVGQVPGMQKFTAAASKSMKRGGVNSNASKMGAEMAHNSLTKGEKELAEAQAKGDNRFVSKNKESIEAARKDFDAKYPDFDKKGFTDAEKYAEYADKIPLSQRTLTDAELHLLGDEKKAVLSDLAEKAGDKAGFFVSPLSQLASRNLVRGEPEDNGDEYKETAWYQKLSAANKKLVDEQMKKKGQ